MSRERRNESRSQNASSVIENLAGMHCTDGTDAVATQSAASGHHGRAMTPTHLITSKTSSRAVCSSSGGKDSLLALWYAKQQGIQPTTLLTMFDESGLRSRSHALPRVLVERQAHALGLKFLSPSAGWADYEEVFVGALRNLRASGHEIAIFGDIDLLPHLEWEQRVCRDAQMSPYLPLWQRNRLQLAHQSIALGFKAIVVCVDSRYLGDEFCGRPFDESFIVDLPAGVDACGENGEFHTFVYDGPLFDHAVEFRLEGRSEYLAPPEFGGGRYCFAALAG